MIEPQLDAAPPPRVSDGARRQAALVVCTMAADRDQARLLLDALGLLNDPAVTARPQRTGRQ